MSYGREESLNLSEIAGLIRLYYPNPEYQGLSDLELIDYFKDYQPELMDNLGGWDEVLDEPEYSMDVLKGQTKTALEMPKEMLFKAPQVINPFSEDRSTLETHVSPTIWGMVDKYTKPFVKPIDRVYTLFGGESKWQGYKHSETGLTVDQLRDLPDEERKKLSPFYSWDNFKNTFKDAFFWEDSEYSKYKMQTSLFDYFPDKYTGSFKAESDEVNMKGKNQAQIDSMMHKRKNIDKDFNLTDALANINEQAQILHSDKFNDILSDTSHPLYPLGEDWLIMANKVYEYNESLKNGEPIPDASLVEAVVKSAEYGYAKIIAETDFGHLPLKDRVDMTNDLRYTLPYHNWERNIKDKTYNEKMDKLYKEIGENIENKLHNDPHYQALDKWNEYNKSENFIRDVMAGDGTGWKRLWAGTYGALTSAFQAIAVTGLTKSTRAGAAYLTSMEMESMAREAITYQTAPEFINLDIMNGELNEYKDELYEKGYEPYIIDSMIEQYKNDNYIVSGKNVMKKGMNPSDAFKIASTSLMFSTGVTYMLEKSLLDGIGKIWGFGGKDLMRKGANRSSINYLIKETRKLPIVGKLGRWDATNSNVLTKMFLSMGGNAAEEMSQYVSQIFFATIGPGGYKKEGFRDEFNWNTLAETAWGGLSMGGALGGASALYTGTIKDRLDNWNKLNNKNKFLKVFSKKNEDNTYNVFYSSATFKRNKDGSYKLDKDGNKIEGPVEEFDTGETFSTFKESYQRVKQLERQFTSEFLDKNKPEVFKDYIGAKTEIKKVGKKYIVDIIGANGNLLNSVTFDTAQKAWNFERQEKLNINSVEKQAEKNADFNERKAGRKSTVTYNEDGTMNVDEDANILAGFVNMLEDGDELDFYDNLDDNKRSPEKILEILEKSKKETGNAFEILNRAGVKKSDLLSAMKDNMWEQVYAEEFSKIDNLLEVPTESEQAEDMDVNPDGKKIVKEDLIEKDEEDISPDTVIEREDLLDEKTVEVGEDIKTEVDVGKYKQYSDQELKDEYLERKAKGGVDMEIPIIRTELKERGLPLPRVTKKVKQKISAQKTPEVGDETDSKFYLEKVKEKASWEDLSDEDLLKSFKGSVLESQKRGNMAAKMNKASIKAELKKRGLELPVSEKSRKQKVLSEEDIKKLAEEEKEVFIQQSIDILNKKFSRTISKTPLQDALDVDTSKTIQFKLVPENERNSSLYNFRGAYDSDTDTIWLNPKYMTMSTPFHEIGHVIARALLNNKQVKGSVLDIYKDIIKDDEGKKLYAWVLKEYPELQEGSDGFIEEVLAETFGEAAKKAKQLSDYQQRNSKWSGIINAWKRFLDLVKRFLFGDNSKYNLDVDFYDFAKDNMTLGKVVDMMLDDNRYTILDDLKPTSVTTAIQYDKLLKQGLILDTKEFESLRKEFGENTDISFEDDIIEYGNAEYNYHTKVVIPAYMNIANDEVDKIIDGIKKLRKYGKDLSSLKPKERKLYRRAQAQLKELPKKIHDRLLKQIGLPKSLWGEKKLSKHLENYKAQIKSDLLDGDNRLLVSSLNHLQDQLVFTRLEDVGLIPPTSDEAAGQSPVAFGDGWVSKVSNAVQYKLIELSFKYAVVDRIKQLQLNTKDTKISYSQLLTSFKGKKPIKTQEQVIFNEFIESLGTVEWSEIVNDDNPLSFDAWVNMYTRFMRKNYNIHAAESSYHQDYVTVQSAFTSEAVELYESSNLTIPQNIEQEDEDNFYEPIELEIGRPLPSKKIYFFAGKAYDTYEKHGGQGIGHNIHLGKFGDTETTDRAVNAAGWYRVQTLPPDIEDTDIAHEYQTDVIAANDEIIKDEIYEYVENPDKYIKKRNEEKQTGLTGETDLITKDIEVLEEKVVKSLGYGWYGKLLNGLPAGQSLNVFEVTWTDDAINLISKHLNNIVNSENGQVKIMSVIKTKWLNKNISHFGNAVDKLDFSPENIKRYLSDSSSSSEKYMKSSSGISEIEKLYIYALTKEYSNLNWEKLSDIIWNKSFVSVEQANTNIGYREAGNIMFDYFAPNSSKILTHTLNKMSLEILDEIVTGRAPKELYSNLLNIRYIEEVDAFDFILSNKGALKDSAIEDWLNEKIFKYNQVLKNRISSKNDLMKINDIELSRMFKIPKIKLNQVNYELQILLEDSLNVVIKGKKGIVKKKLIETFRDNDRGFYGFIFGLRNRFKNLVHFKEIEKENNEFDKDFNEFLSIRKMQLSGSIGMIFQERLLKRIGNLTRQVIPITEFRNKSLEIMKDIVTEDATKENIDSQIDEILPGVLGPAKNLVTLKKSLNKIRILNSIQRSAANGKPSLHIGLGAVNLMIQGNDLAFSFYNTADESAWNYLMNVFREHLSTASFPDGRGETMSRVEKASSIVNNIVDKFDFLSNAQKDEIGKDLYEAYYEPQHNNKTNAVLWRGSEAQKLVLKHYREIKKVESEETGETIELPMIKGKTGPFIKDLNIIVKDMKKQGLIDYEILTPSWSKGQTMKITYLNIPGVLSYQTFRMQKVIEKHDAESSTPKDLNQLSNKINNQIRYQKIEDPNLSKNIEINRIFKNAWLDLNIVMNETNKALARKFYVHPEYFRHAMMSMLPPELHSKFSFWYDTMFSKHSSLAYKDTAVGKAQETLVPQEEIDMGVSSFLTEIERANREGWAGLIDKNESDERSLSSNDFAYRDEFGVHVDFDVAKQLNKLAYSIMRDLSIENKFDTWVKEVSKIIGKRASYPPSMTRKQIKKFNRLFSSLTINSEGGKMNARDNFYAIITKYDVITDSEGNFAGTVAKEMSIELKGPDSKLGGKNNSTDKITPFELNNNEKYTHLTSIRGGLISFISGKDVLQNKKSRYGFFTADELSTLNDELYTQHSKTIVMSRGDSDKLLIVDVTDNHKAYYKSMGFDSAQELAVHSAMTSIFPDYLDMDAATVGKRIKLPFTPMTISPSMTDVNMYIADKEKLVFKYREKTNKGYRLVETVDNLYIGDGGSITARQLFEAFELHHGLTPGQAKAKTVIYKNRDGEGVAVKHQHYQPESGIEIWEGDTLLARVDENGNFVDGEAAGMDMIITQDEAKWVYGGATSKKGITVSGREIGFTKYADEKYAVTGNHMMQWYNHITDSRVISAFKNHILSNVKAQIAGIYRDFSDTTVKSASKRVSDIIEKIDINDEIGFRNTLVELNKLGFVWHLEPMLNVLYQTKEMTPTLKIKRQPGTKADLAPNLRGDLKRGEAALSKSNAEQVLLKFATAKNISLKVAEDTDVSEINEWLAENPVNMFMARSPIPHAGGAMIIRIKRLFNRGGLIELSPYDVFARLEGDYDGDWVSLEMLPYEYTDGKFVSEIEDTFIEFFKELEVGGINLNEFDSKLGQLDLSKADDRFRLMEAMTYNKQGEIVNIQSIYGLLVNTIDHINVTGVGRVELKQPDEKVKFNVGKIDGKIPTFTVSKILRIYLQAAVDNAKYMLLQQWNYTYDGLSRSLFKYGEGHPQAGQTISATAFKKLKPYLKFLKTPNKVRSGFDFEEGKLRLSDTIDESSTYYQYTRDRESYIKGIAPDIRVSFKSNILTPIEEIAIAPYVEYEIWQNKYNIIGSDGSPIKLHYNVHRNAHDRAVEYFLLPSIAQQYLRDAFLEDTKSGLVQGKKSAWAKSEWDKGELYARNMLGRFKGIIDANDKSADSPTFMERNEPIVVWKTNFDKDFKALSRVAQVAATYHFLEGWDGTKTRTHIPPASRSKSEKQLLDAKILSKFAELYNKEVANNRNMEKRFNRVGDLMIEKHIEEVCG
tara:strand:- start:814 stop:12045 length:11232 start_codon:yes stop_codon:yes gene_type:complete